MGNFYSVPTSIGQVIPREAIGNGRGAFIETADVPFTGNVYDNTAHELGTFTLDNHTYVVYHGRWNQSPTVWVYRDGTQLSELYINVMSTWSGFWCDIQNNLATMYWISAPEPSAVANYGFPLPTGYTPGNLFEARTIVSGVSTEDVPVADWDKSPSTDYTDPDNEDPRGGEYADTEPFGTTDLMPLTGLPNPDAEQSFNYGTLVVTYCMNATEFQSVAANLFQGGVLSDLKNKFQGLSDPFEFILNAIQVPFSVNGTSNQPFCIGGTEVTGTNVTRITTRYLKRDMGSIKLSEVWGTARDYSDISIELFLPYVGIKEVDADLCLNATNTLTCYIDAWTGDVTYLLHVSNTNSSGKYYRTECVPYRWTGNCAKKVPLGRIDNSGQILAAVGAIAGIALAVGTAGAAAPAAGAAEGATVAAGKSATTGISTAAAGGAVASFSQVFKPTVQTSGGVAGNFGAMDYQKAYFIVKRAVPQYPNGWRSQIGAPRYQTFTLSDLSGFTLFADILLDNMGVAVEEEIQELKRLLTTEGVIL